MAKVIMNPVGMAELLRSPQGPVMRRLILYAEKVKAETIASMKSDFPRNFLGPSIVKRLGMDGQGGYVDVLSNRTKTAAHVIEGNPMLVFFWPKVGRVVAFPRVNHPGSEFGPYLIKQLNAAIKTTAGSF